MTNFRKLAVLAGIVCVSLPFACDKNGATQQPKTSGPPTTEPTAPEENAETPLTPASRAIDPIFEGDSDESQQQPVDQPDPMPAPESVPDEAPDVPFSGDAGIVDEPTPEGKSGSGTSEPGSTPPSGSVGDMNQAKPKTSPNGGNGARSGGK